MKKLISLSLILTLAWLPSPGRPTLSTSGDTLIIAHEGDTVRLTGEQSINHIISLLDDTLLNITPDNTETNTEKDRQEIDFALASQRIWASVIDSITTVSVWGVAMIVFIALLFSYLKRRRKYKMVEKAIEANYPLPPYVFDAGTMPTPGYVTPPMAQAAHGQEHAAEQPATGDDRIPPIPDQPDAWTQQQATPVMGEPRMNWRAFQSSLVLIAIGLGMMFVTNRGGGIFAILAIIGLGKAFIEYQDQRDAINAYRNRNAR